MGGVQSTNYADADKYYLDVIAAMPRYVHLNTTLCRQFTLNIDIAVHSTYMYAMDAEEMAMPRDIFLDRKLVHSIDGYDWAFVPRYAVRQDYKEGKNIQEIRRVIDGLLSLSVAEGGRFFYGAEKAPWYDYEEYEIVDDTANMEE